VTDSRATSLPPGVSCFVWTWLLVGSFVLCLLFIVPILVLGFLSRTHPGVLPVFHALLWWWLGVTVVLPSITAVGKVAKERREVMAGYTTLPRSYLNVDYRDWKSGAVIRRGGSDGAHSGRFSNPQPRAPFTNSTAGGQDQSQLSQPRGAKHVPRWLWVPALLITLIIVLRVIAEVARYNTPQRPRDGGFNTLDQSMVVIVAVVILFAFLLWWAAQRISSRFSTFASVQPQDTHLRGIFRAEMVGAFRLAVSPDISDKAAKLGNPFGVIADGHGLSFWRVGRRPDRLFVVAWQQIDAIELGAVATPDRTFPSILIRLTGVDGNRGVPVWLSSERRRGLFPQTESEVLAVIDRLGEYTRRIDC
jgi:hypothetical protein